MLIESANKDKRSIDAVIPLTATAGKIRIKQRRTAFEQGVPFASRQNPFSQENYIEWQISYGAEIPRDTSNYKEKNFKNFSKTSIKNIPFVGHNGKQSALYELSEYCYYFVSWGTIARQDLIDIQSSLQSLSDDDMLDKHSHCQIKRTSPVSETIHGLDFQMLKIEYPQLTYRFRDYEIIAEIVIKEKQRAVGIQPMLYFCFPLAELKSRGEPLIGRCAEKNESALFTIDEGNSGILLEMIKIFGILSEAHRLDVIAMLDAILGNT